MTYVPRTWGKKQKKAYLDAKASGDESKPKAFMQSHPELFGGVEAAASSSKVSQPVKIKNADKSPGLRAFEHQVVISAANPTFKIFKRELGQWYLIGTTDEPSPEAIGEEFGGGRFLVRRCDEAGVEMQGPGNAVTLNLHPGVYGDSKIAPIKTTRIKDDEEFEDIPSAKFTDEDIEAAKKEAEEKAKLQSTIAQLQAHAFSPDTPKEDRLDTLTKLVELQRALMPPPPIGEAKSMTDTIAGIAGAITAAFGAWQQVKKMMPPAQEASSSGGMVERLFGTLAEKVGTTLIERQLAQPDATAKPDAPSSVEENTKMLDAMMDELAMEIAKQQEIESTTKKDTVAPMVQWILEQKGMAWDILRSQARSNDTDKVVAFISSKRATLVDSDFKRAWVKNVVEVLKTPEAIGK